MTVQDKEKHEVKSVGRRNVEYFDAHYDEYLDIYPDHWIAIHDGEFVGAEANFYDLVDHVKTKGFSFKDTLIDKVESKDILWFLPS